MPPSRWPGRRCRASTTPHEDSHIYKMFWNPNSTDGSPLGASGARAGRVTFDETIPPGYGQLGYLRAAKARLAAAGWTTGPVFRFAGQWGDLNLVARHGGLTVTVTTARDGDHSRTVHLDILRTTPPGVPRAALEAGLLAALVAAGAFGWAAVRARAAPAGTRVAFVAAVGATVVLLGPAVLLSAPLFVGPLGGVTNFVAEPPVYWVGFTMFGAEPMAMLAVLPAALALLLGLGRGWPFRWPR